MYVYIYIYIILAVYVVSKYVSIKSQRNTPYMYIIITLLVISRCISQYQSRTERLSLCWFVQKTGNIVNDDKPSNVL